MAAAAETYVEHLNRCVVPIFRTSASQIPEHEGSGVLVLTASARWLVTAAHVMAVSVESHLYLPGRPAIFPISGYTYSTCNLNNADVQRDPFDLAFAKLTDVEARSLVAAGHGFHSSAEDSILSSHRDFLNDWCYVCGYPSESVDVDPDVTTMTGNPFMFQGDLHTDQEMRIRGCDPARQMGLRYDQIYSLDNKPFKRPNPKGMSGGPIWVNENGRAKLAGLTVEFDKAKSLIIGTRLMNLFQAMEHQA